MRAPAVLVLCPFVLLPALACATRFESGPLRPIPHAAPAAGLPYAQVRELAVARPVHLIWLRFGEGPAAGRHEAVTLDVRNDTPGPLLLELSRAHLRHEADGQTATRSVVAAGLGSIPRSIDLDSPGEPALELAPGAGQTIWLAFAPLPRPTQGPLAQRNGRASVVVPVTAAGEVAVQVQDDGASPRWESRVTSAYGLRLGTSARVFDSGAGRFNEFNAAFFLAQGPLTGSLTVGAFTLHERLRGGIAHAGGPSLGLDLAFRPIDFALGAFVAANHQAVDFDEASGEPDRSLFSTTVGLVCPLEGGIAPLAAIRVGYTHLFGDETPYHGGLFFALDVRLFFN